MSKSYGDLVLEARSRAGISQRELARRAGTSQAVISEYERAQREPGIRQLQRVIAAAGFDLDLNLVPTPRSRPEPAPRDGALSRQR